MWQVSSRHHDYLMLFSLCFKEKENPDYQVIRLELNLYNIKTLQHCHTSQTDASARLCVYAYVCFRVSELEKSRENIITIKVIVFVFSRYKIYLISPKVDYKVNTNSSKQLSILCPYILFLFFFLPFFCPQLLLIISRSYVFSAQKIIYLLVAHLLHRGQTAHKWLDSSMSFENIHRLGCPLKPSGEDLVRFKQQSKQRLRLS